MSVINAAFPSDLFRLTAQVNDAIAKWEELFQDTFTLTVSQVLAAVRQALSRFPNNKTLFSSLWLDVIAVNGTDPIFKESRHYSLTFSFYANDEKINLCEFLFVDHRSSRGDGNTALGSNDMMLAGFKHFTEAYFDEYIQSTGKAFLTCHPSNDSVEKLGGIMYTVGAFNGIAHGLFKTNAHSAITFKAGRWGDHYDISMCATTHDGLDVHYAVRTDAIGEWLGFRRV